MRKSGIVPALLVVSAAFLLAAGILSRGVRGLPAPPRVPLQAAELLAAHNKARAEHGAHPLTLDPRLQSAAIDHAIYMVQVGKMKHSGIGDGTAAERVRRSGYVSNYDGENIAYGYGDIPAVMKGWLSSPGHRANILRNGYYHMGAASANDANGRPYWCAVFAAPAPAYQGGDFAIP